MGWTKECQERRFAQYTLEDWREWANSLPPEGFGRYTQEDWKLWINQIANESCASSEQAEGEHSSSRTRPWDRHTRGW